MPQVITQCACIITKLKVLILITNFYTFLLMLVLRMWRCIKTVTSSSWFSLFSSHVCLTLYWYCKRKLYVDQLLRNWRKLRQIKVFRFYFRVKRVTRLSLKTSSGDPSVSYGHNRHRKAIDNFYLNKGNVIHYDKPRY